MGHLAEDMTRLREEIVSLHHGRQAFLQNVERNVAALRAGFRTEHLAMARAGKTERMAAVSNLKRAVATLRSGFADDLRGAERAWAGSSFASRAVPGRHPNRPTNPEHRARDEEARSPRMNYKRHATR